MLILDDLTLIDDCILFSIDMSEAAAPLESYETIEDVFTRKLRPGIRKVEKSFYCSPCDSVLTVNEAIKGQKQTFKIKEIEYSLAELLDNKVFSPAWISVFYLAPHNYHRVHAPVDGKITSIKYLPGSLWPVNPFFLKHLPKIFNTNERLIFKIEAKQGGTVYLVMVGALNVGRMTTPFSKKIKTNSKVFFKKPFLETLTPPKLIQKGDEIGTFMLGSTVILFFDKQALNGLCSTPTKPNPGDSIKVGESLL